MYNLKQKKIHNHSTDIIAMKQLEPTKLL